MSYSLFSPETTGELFAPDPLPGGLASLPAFLPAGLRYQNGYVESRLEARLLEVIDAEPWLDDLKRRVQHYGYRYDYRSRSIDRSMYLGPLPPWACYFAQKLHHDGLLPYEPDQVIVNEYQPGQGIAAHIDCTPCFEDGIASISLGSACVMQFTHRLSEQDRLDVPLMPRSVVALSGEARYEWLHGIRPVKSDVIAGRKYLRGRRVSLTFRKVRL